MLVVLPDEIELADLVGAEGGGQHLLAGVLGCALGGIGHDPRTGGFARRSLERILDVERVAVLDGAKGDQQQQAEDERKLNQGTAAASAKASRRASGGCWDCGHSLHDTLHCSKGHKMTAIVASRT